MIKTKGVVEPEFKNTCMCHFLSTGLLTASEWFSKCGPSSFSVTQEGVGNANLQIPRLRTRPTESEILGVQPGISFNR